MRMPRPYGEPRRPAASALVLGPLLGEEGVAHAVEPPARPVQRVPEGVHLAAHPDPLHQAPRGLVVGEAVGLDASEAEVLEAEADQLADGLRRVAVALLVRVEGPAEL